MNKQRPTRTVAQALTGMNFEKNDFTLQEVKTASDLSPFEQKKKTMVDAVVAKFMKDRNTDLNATISELAKSEGFNKDETMRVIQAVNNCIYQSLYAETVGKTDRSVKFTIADIDKVMPVEAASTGVVDENNEKVASLQKPTFFEKIASYQMDEHNTYSPAAVPGADVDFLMERVASDLKSTALALEKVAGEVKGAQDLLGVAFSKYASAGLNVQTIFEKMAKQSNMRKTKQADIIETYNRVNALSKKASENPSLELVDIDAVKDFSLGRHSISKIAEQDVLSLPEVSDKKREVKDFQKLVELAIKIQSDEAMQKNLEEKLEAKRELVAQANSQGGSNV